MVEQTFRALRRILDGQPYKEAAAKAARLKKGIEGASDFRLDSLISEAQQFFAELRERNPTIYAILGIQEKEIAELAFRKKTGREIVIG